MVKDHPVFNEPKNKSQKIWRYLDFTKFIDLLNNNSLFFCRSDLFTDQFEGSVPKNTAVLRDFQFKEIVVNNQKSDSRYTSNYLQVQGKKDRKNIALNCWHMNDYESAAMWNLYLKSDEGIAIQSTYNKLKDCLDESEITIHLGTVNYIDYNKDTIAWNNLFIPYIHKRKSFKHEKELRALIWSIDGVNTKSQVDFSNGGISIPVDVNKLVEKIYVSPDSPLWYTNLVQSLTSRFGFDIEVINSKINDNPIF